MDPRSTQHPALSTPLLVIAGPTGSGKSDLALRLAQALRGEIVNYDSVQIYRGFDIGSAKPSPAERALVPHHLFDIVDAGAEFNAADYGRLAREVCAALTLSNTRPILVGGTFFYLRALLSGLPEMPGRDERLRARIRRIADQPRGAARLHGWLSKIDPRSGRKIAPADRHRVERALEVWIRSGRPISSWEPEGSDELPSIKLGLRVDRARLGPILDARVEEMFRRGLVAETRALLERFPATARPFGTIGYREAVAVVHGTMTEGEAIEETRRRTRAYAKRQMTWLRSERNVQWVDANDRDETFAAALRCIEEHA
ncbi:MAG TPA: tRNA (adenosine(37)-N6)-dimethylallyltransferase MiaA [Thermoanaerobaculia bacterium]|nr:tRNA (adenosine(37)-N6)-dimethylallyltransferase MiaA [Thermoanaerobaculia bacterium]